MRQNRVESVQDFFSPSKLLNSKVRETRKPRPAGSFHETVSSPTRPRESTMHTMHSSGSPVSVNKRDSYQKNIQETGQYAIPDHTETGGFVHRPGYIGRKVSTDSEGFGLHNGGKNTPVHSEACEDSRMSKYSGRGSSVKSKTISNYTRSDTLARAREQEERRQAEQRKLAEQRMEAEERRKAEDRMLGRLAEARRQEEEQRRMAEERRLQRITEERKLVEERRMAEQKRLERLAEERRQEDQKRHAEEWRITEERRLFEERKLEERRQADERRIAQERRLFEQRKQEDKRQQQRRQQERRQQERRQQERRQAQQRRRAEDEEEKSSYMAPLRKNREISQLQIRDLLQKLMAVKNDLEVEITDLKKLLDKTSSYLENIDLEYAKIKEKILVFTSRALDASFNEYKKNLPDWTKYEEVEAAGMVKLTEIKEVLESYQGDKLGGSDFGSSVDLQKQVEQYRHFIQKVKKTQVDCESKRPELSQEGMKKFEIAVWELGKF